MLLALQEDPAGPVGTVEGALQPPGWAQNAGRRDVALSAFLLSCKRSFPLIISKNGQKKLSKMLTLSF